MFMQVLTSIGLSEKEAKIYLTLLEIGSQPISVAAKKANINRTTSYLIIDDLKKKGLVSTFTKESIKYVTAEPPESILKFLQLEQNRLENQKTNIQEHITELKSIQHKSAHKPKVYFYEGLQGIIQTYQDTINVGQTIYAIECDSEMSTEIEEYLHDHYIPERIKKNIYAEAIMPDSKENQEVKKRDSKEYRKTKLIDKPFFNFKVDLNIYGNKTAFIVFEGNNYMSVIIESEEIANSLKALFKIVWTSLA
jgi:sugar-specific transcriptional regulator TrmB